MTKLNHRITMNEFSASEGVFADAQVNRLGITRGAAGESRGRQSLFRCHDGVVNMTHRAF